MARSRKFLVPQESDRIPVSLLTGFLGSGKTTVLNGLLQNPSMKSTAVIINEFGAIGLDHDLIEFSKENLVLLRSGCLCCTVRGDLIATLGDLLQKRERNEIAAFSRVLIETTGLADPAPILHTLMTDPRIALAFRLDGVLVTVDAASGAATLNKYPEAVKQAAVADRLLLTKGDLVTPATTSALVSSLCTLNPAAPIIHVRMGSVAPQTLFGAGLYDPNTKSPDVARWLNAEAYPPSKSGQIHGTDELDHAHTHDPNRHDNHIRAVCLIEEEPIDGDALICWLETLVFLKGADLLRIKGIINIKDMEPPIVIHGVQHIFHPAVMLKKWPSVDRRSKLAFITRDIDEEMLRYSLKRFILGRSGEQPWPQVATPSTLGLSSKNQV
jgi:G3E family GTPase